MAGGGLRGGQILGQYPRGLDPNGDPARSTHIMSAGRVVPTTPWEAPWHGIAQWFGVQQQQMGTVLPLMNRFPQESLYRADQLFRLTSAPPVSPSPPSLDSPAMLFLIIAGIVCLLCGLGSIVYIRNR
jgi:hypothetical protein